MNAPAGLKQVPYPGDYPFSEYLRRMNALGNWTKSGNSNVWHNPEGKPVAVCVYDNAASRITQCFILKTESV